MSKMISLFKMSIETSKRLPLHNIQVYQCFMQVLDVAILLFNKIELLSGNDS